jgi:ATP-dependent DNA helicase RecQ
LRGDVTLHLREDPALPARGRKRGAKHAVPETDAGLWHALRARRKALADAQNVPPYVIFHDATLAEMIAVRPRTAAELLSVGGVGKAKLERYGEAFLEIIRDADDAAERSEWAIRDGSATP